MHLKNYINTNKLFLFMTKPFYLVQKIITIILEKV